MIGFAMDERQKPDRGDEESDGVTPVESPSENYLVIENLREMPSVFSRGLLYLVVLAVLSGLLYSILGRIDIVTECRAVARPDTPQIKILSDQSGFIEKVLVEEGQVVERDAPLFHIRLDSAPSLHDVLPEDDRYEPERTPFVTVVRAEHEGILSELTVADVGEYVQKHDALCTILPKDASLYMDITVLNKDIGFIATGMEVKYKFDAFPYTDCGLLFGKVGMISPSATEDRALGLVYHVHGTLEAICFDIHGDEYHVKPGMTATAELVTGTKSILSILFSRLKG